MVVAPPRKISPPAGHFVCSLLRQDHRKRLGTASDTEVGAPACFSWLLLLHQVCFQIFL